MTFSQQESSKEYASLSKKVYQYVSDRSLLQLTRDIFQNGFPLFRRFVALYFDKNFDKKYSVDTCGSIHLHELTIPDKGNIESASIYDPAPAQTVRKLFSYLPSDLNNYTLIDFGSGKGRVMFVGAEYPFRKIVGVEFASDLHEVAVDNIKNYRNSKQKCSEIESVCADAANYEIPEDNCIFYFFAPFKQDVLQSVIENIKQSYQKAPRSMWILYITDPVTHPTAFEIIRNSGIFTQVRAEYFPFEIAQRDKLYYEIYKTN